MTEPPEDTSPFLPMRGLGPDPEPMPAPPEEPPRSRNPLGAAVVFLSVLALALAAGAFWVYESGSSHAADLNAQLQSAKMQLDSADSQLTDVKAQLDKATKDTTTQSGKITKLNNRIKTLRKKVNSSTPKSTFPVVAYSGQVGNGLQSQFLQKLVQPLVADAQQNQPGFLVSLYIQIPASTGVKYTYTAIYSDGASSSVAYGTKGSALPTWTSACSSGGC